MKIALIGAGGKMGARLAANLVGSDYDVAYVEVSEAGRARLKEPVGVDCVPLDDAARWRRRRRAGRAGHRDRQGRVGDRAEARAGNDRHRPRRRGALRRPSAGTRRRDLLRHPPLPSADLQRRGRAEATARPLRRHRGQAGDRQRADAGARGALCGRRGDRQGDLAADPALAPGHGRPDGDARARPVGDGLRDAAGRHEGRARRGGAPRRRPDHARATSCSAT